MAGLWAQARRDRASGSLCCEDSSTTGAPRHVRFDTCDGAICTSSYATDVDGCRVYAARGPQRNRSLVEAAYPDRSQHLFTLAALAACQVAQVFNMASTNKMTDSVEKTSSGRQVSGGGDLAE